MDNIVQQLITLLLDNFILVFIIGGVILNIFKRFKDVTPEQNDQQRPVERQGNREQNYDEENERRSEQNPFETIFDELNRKGKEISKQNEKTAPSHIEKVEQRKPTASTEPYERYNKLNKEDNPRGKKSSPKQVNRISTQYQPMKRVTKKRAVEGIIWSEILGPPRSKRPHSSRGRYLRPEK